MKADCLGNIYSKDFKGGYAGNVWSVVGASPTLKTMQGGNNQPLIIVINQNDKKRVKQKKRNRGGSCNCKACLRIRQDTSKSRDLLC